MNKKKLKTKIAKSIRNRYNLDFITSLKISKTLLRDKIDSSNVLYDLGFKADREYVAVCARGCCFEYRDTFYYGKDKHGKYIQFKYKDLEQLKEKIIREYKIKS